MGSWGFLGVGYAHLRSQGPRIAAGTALQGACDPADGGDADLGQLVDFAVGHALLQQGHHPPAVGHRLQLRWSAQVLQEGLDRRTVIQTTQGRSQGLQAVFGGVGVLVHAPFHETRIM